MFTPSPLPPSDLDETVKVFIPVRSGTIFLEPGAQTLLRSEVAPIDAPESFLGVLDGVGAYSIDLNDSSEEADLEPVHLRKLYGRISDEEWVLAGRAEQIINYERTHQYCGRCGTPTETNPHDRGKFCPNCKHIAFPRLSPAMIVLVEREDVALQEHDRARRVEQRAANRLLAARVEPEGALRARGRLLLDHTHRAQRRVHEEHVRAGGLAPETSAARRRSPDATARDFGAGISRRGRQPR